MRRTNLRVLLLVTAAVLCVSAWLMACKPDERSNEKKQAPAQKTAVALSGEHEKKPSSHPEEADSNSPDGHTPIKRPEWWLVGVAILTCIVIGWQAYETRKAAQAAGASAEAIINSERSWVLADVEDLTIKDMLLCQVTGSETTLVFCRLKNYGAKPVWITAVSCSLKVVGSVGELPEEPDYGDWKPLEVQLPLLPESTHCCLRRSLPISVAEYQSVLAGKRQLYVYGFATYKDAFELPRESRFCFLYAGNPPSFQFGGPKGYNRYT